ncbi:MAG: hypothetical protein HZA74_11105 [Ignavibacteriales bacterium]|nr:hypothetical protein [Ignavibacteriales bacterium]
MDKMQECNIVATNNAVLQTMTKFIPENFAKIEYFYGTLIASVLYS